MREPLSAHRATVPAPTVRPLPRIDTANIDMLVLSGGGNRCWWQAGVLAQWMRRSLALPPQLVGTSAGAAVAASCLTEGPQAALDACLRLYADNEHVFHWRALPRFKFAHQHVYPAWLAAFVHEGNVHKLRNARSRLGVAVTRPAPRLGLAASVLVGTVAYLVDTYVSRNLHPRLPGRLGLRHEFIELNALATAGEAQLLLAAAAAAPPILPARRIGHAMAFDGGYTDNTPLPLQSEQQRSRTLVLLTRHDPRRPLLFRHAGRLYWQPSCAIPVSTWDCRPHTTVRDAFALGEQDACALLPARQTTATHGEELPA